MQLASPRQMISFIVPAHNEQARLGGTLQAIHESARVADQPYEIIVVDDASTDLTSDIARQNNAHVISVNHRQIAATRNSGGHAAQGTQLFFVDADTTINSRVVCSALQKMDRGAAGGGALVRFEDSVPLYARLLLWWLNLFMRLIGMTGGAFMFCMRDAFHAVGGFDERLFGAEDAAFSWSLKREGRFVVLWTHVCTSGRRARGMGGLQMVAALVRMAFFPKMLTRRSSVDKVWYNSNREADDRPSSSIAIRLSNFILLVIMIAMLSGPIWLVPWPQTVIDGPLGTVKFVCNIIGLHFGLILWPCAYFLIRILLKQKRWVERIKLVILIVLCLWLVWGNTEECLAFWMWVYQWLSH
jgi:glycosyltransferase involved in cell wall biosynthesis